jgi:hypothetical protein
MTRNLYTFDDFQAAQVRTRGLRDDVQAKMRAYKALVDAGTSSWMVNARNIQDARAKLEEGQRAAQALAHLQALERNLEASVREWEALEKTLRGRFEQEEPTP